MTSCCVKSYSSRPGSPGISFFRFPVIRNIAAAQSRNAWLKAIGNRNMDLEGAVICSRHFIEGRPVKLEVYQGDTNDLSEICRLCMVKEVKLMKLFQDGTGTNSALVKKIYDCTTVKIKMNPTYPAAICATCYTKLDEYSKFREKCIENDGILRMIMGDVGDEKGNVGSSEQVTVNRSEFAASEAASSSTVVAASTGQVPKKTVISTDNLATTNVSSTVQNNVNIRSQNGRPKCVICARSFFDKYTLRTHMKLHTGELYTCEYCGKKFNHRPNLKIHLRVHTRENLTRCAVCFKTFTTIVALKYHLQVHRKLKVFECRLCAEVAETYEGLATHVKTKHDHVQLDDLTRNNIDDSFLAGYFWDSPALLSINSGIQDCDMEPIPDSPILTTAAKSEVPAGLQILDDVQVHINQEPMDVGTPQSDSDGVNQVQLQPTAEGEAPRFILFRCDCCTQVFKSVSAVREHMKTHNDNSAPKNVIIIPSFLSSPAERSR